MLFVVLIIFFMFVGSINFALYFHCLKGKFYKATGEGFFPALLLLPGFPGNETDVLGLGKRLAGKGINVMMINYSGTHQSRGLWGFNNVMSDISAANAFLSIQGI